MRRRWAATLAAIGLWVAAPPIWAAPVTLRLEPDYAQVTFRAYAVGLFPIDGDFARFSGTLSLDPTRPGFCRVVLDVEVGSLRMDDHTVRDDVLSSGLLDAATFPRFVFDGACESREAMVGALTLHGETHGLNLAITHKGDEVSAEAVLHRADWGVRGRPLLAGPTIRIRVTTSLPRDLSGATPAP